VAQTSKLITKSVVVFDSFTPDMYIPGTLCTSSSSITCEGQTLYDLGASSTGMNLDSMTTVDFGIGTVSGDVVSDNVSVGEFEVSSLK
jgi:hypothetical protein